jgi:general secretion pathway protein F
MTRATPPPLALDTRAILFRQLGAMEDAGVPPDKALHLIRLPSIAQLRLGSMRRYLRDGLGIADAGSRSGLFTPLEASLLRAAASGGRLAQVYRRLAEHCSRQASRVAAIKSRMTLPLAMLVIAILVQPVPRLVAGTLSPGGYLIKCLVELLALGGAVCLITGLPRRMSSASTRCGILALDEILPLVPPFRSMHERRSVRDGFETLALLLEAGMPILEALPLSVDAMRSLPIKRQFSGMAARIDAGASFAQAIGELTFVGSDQAHAMIAAGEASGALPEVLSGYAASETAAIGRFDDLVAEWAPRVAYALVVIWIGVGILASGAFMPRVPPDL